jgi:hypothetical protein
MFTRFDLTFLVAEPTRKGVGVYRQWSEYADGGAAAGACRGPAGWGRARPALPCPSGDLCPNGSWFPGPYMYKPPLTA